MIALSPKSVAVLALALALWGSAGCKPDEAYPEGAVKQLFRAVAMRDNAKVYRLLAPETQKQLQRWAELATAHTGGRRRFKPEELLAPSLDQPRFRLGNTSLVSEEGNKAQVRLYDPTGKHTEVLDLVRVGKTWRILLPKKTFARVAPPTPPRPATRPAKPTTASSSPTTQPTTSPAGGQPASKPASKAAPKAAK